MCRDQDIGTRAGQATQQDSQQCPAGHSEGPKPQVAAQGWPGQGKGSQQAQGNQDNDGTNSVVRRHVSDYSLPAWSVKYTWPGEHPTLRVRIGPDGCLRKRAANFKEE